MKTTPFLLIITAAVLVSCAAISSAVVPSDPAAAPSDAGGKNHHETSTAGSGGYPQIGTSSGDIPTGLRPNDGTNVGPSSTAITEYLPPGYAIEQILKKWADVGVPKKDAEVAENSPVAASDENIVGITDIPAIVKDTGMTIVTDNHCYDCTDEATIWTLGGTNTIGTDTTKKDANRKTAADSSFDGNANELVKKEGEDVPVEPIVDPVGPTSDMPVHGNANTGPVHLAKTIITADQTLVDATDVMADIANLYTTSVPTPVPTANSKAETEEHGPINGTAADVDVPPKPPKNGTTVTSIITNTTTTSNVTSSNNPEVGDDNDYDTSPKPPRINGKKDSIGIVPSNTVPGNAKTILAANHTMIDITDAMAVIAGLIELEKKPGLPDELKKATNGTTPSTPTVFTATTDTTKKRTTTTTTTTKKKTRSIFLPKPTFRDDVPVIHRFLHSIPAYLPDPFVLIVIAVESVYDFVATNSVGDVVSKATRVISEGIAKIASGLHYAATMALGKATTLLTKAAESITKGIIKISFGLTDAATVVLGKATTLKNEVNATVMEAIDAIDEADVKAFDRCIADSVDTFKANNPELVDGFVAAVILSLSGLVFLAAYFCILRFFM